MNWKSYGILISIATFSCTMNTRAQRIDKDSLRRSILKSIPNQKDWQEWSRSFLDSSKKWSTYSPVDMKQLQEAIDKEISAAKSAGDVRKVSRGYGKLSSLDSSKGNYKGAYENYKLYANYRDSLQKMEFEKKQLQAQMQRDFDKKQAQQRIEQEQKGRRNSTRQMLLFSFLLVFITVAAALFIAYKREQKRKKLVHVQKKEIEETLSELRATQAQLIQSEKMASLGELTAGIAHEIQNPLNFVNNFSEVNNELIEELKSQNSKVKSGNLDDADQLLSDIYQNNDKIILHGKRADAIVKSMLQHSRMTTGSKEPTDINALADEYLRLAYHGLRAKDKFFTAKLQTNFDASLPMINVVPQDIGRVFLNMINNAFYAVSERQKKEGEGFHPTVIVTTRKINETAEIRVKDNGNGIPKDIGEKIFQPFFTTKPTGQGTGLGLSLSYDIIKAHGGDIKIENSEGQGATFIVVIPVT